jgi:predicted MFS family arabinose efflux permease
LPYAKAITAWFDRQRGLALGIAMSGVGIGAALVPQVADLLVKMLGWREAYVVLGILTWLVAFPLVLFFVKEPSHSSTQENVRMSPAIGDDIGVALRKKEFWLIAIAVLLVVTAINGTIAHLVALLTDRGMAHEVATRMLIAVGLSTILGRLVAGYLLDRVFAPYLAAVIFLVPLLGMLAIWTGAASPVFAILVATSLGFSLGAEVDVIGYLVGRYFGLRRYGQIYGYMFAVFTVGTGAGPYLMGLSFDVTHSYAAALGLFSAMLLVSSVMIAMLDPYRYPEQVGDAAKPLASEAA